MVLPAPAADSVAAEADVDAWLGKLARALDRSRGPMVVLLRDATPAWLGPVVRRLSPAPPWAEAGAEILRVCLTAPELATVEVGARVLLRARLEDTTWLNLRRPLIADRRLRLILWADAETADALQRQAVDFSSWVSRVVQVPARVLPGFIVGATRAALDAESEIAWRGPLLEATLRAAGWEGGVVELPVAIDHRTMLEHLARPGLPLVTGVETEHDAWRVRMALALGGRSAQWVALEPKIEVAGMVGLDGRQAEWDEAAASLAGAGWERAPLLAAWLDLAPARVELACDRVGQVLEWGHDELWLASEPDEIRGMLVVHLRELGDQTPGEALIESLAIAGFHNVALELAVIRLDRGEALEDPNDVLFAQLLARDFASPQLQHGHAQSRISLGELYLALGQRERARDHYERALSTLEELIANEPERPGLRQQLAVSHVQLGDLYRSSGELQRARTHYEEGRSILEEVAAREPEREDIQLNLVGVYSRLGDLHGVLGEGEQARKYHEGGLALVAMLASRASGRLDLGRALSDYLIKIGDFHIEQGEREQARRYFENALVIGRELVEREPSRSEFQLNLSMSLQRMGNLALDQGDQEQAKHYYEDALTIDRELVNRDPDRLDLQRSLSVTLSKLGDLHQARGDIEQAKRAFDDALSIHQELVHREPGRVDLKRDLSAYFHKFGDLYISLGDKMEARRHYEDAVAIARDLVEREPDRVDRQHDLVVMLSSLGNLHLAQGDVDCAKPHYEESLAISAKLVEREPGRPDLQRSLALALDNLGRIHLALGNIEQAKHLFERVLTIFETLTEQHPDHLVFQRSLASSLDQMTRLDETRAQGWLEQAMPLRRAAHARSPKDAVVTRELAMTLVQLGARREDLELKLEALQLLEGLRSRGALEHDYLALTERLATYLQDQRPSESD